MFVCVPTFLSPLAGGVERSNISRWDGLLVAGEGEGAGEGAGGAEEASGRQPWRGSGAALEAAARRAAMDQGEKRTPGELREGATGARPLRTRPPAQDGEGQGVRGQAGEISERNYLRISKLHICLLIC